MKELRKMIIAVLSNAISVEEFEEWMYKDPFVNSNVEDEFVLELLSIDFRSRHARHELENVAFLLVSKEEVIMSVIQQACSEFIEKRTDESVELLFDAIIPYYEWDCDYFLVEQFYWLVSEWELSRDGYAQKPVVKKDIEELATAVLHVFDHHSLEAGILLVRRGAKVKSQRVIHHVVKEPSPNKWYQFWKK